MSYYVLFLSTWASDASSIKGKELNKVNWKMLPACNSESLEESLSAQHWQNYNIWLKHSVPKPAFNLVLVLPEFWKNGHWSPPSDKAEGKVCSQHLLQNLYHCLPFLSRLPSHPPLHTMPSTTIPKSPPGSFMQNSVPLCVHYPP